MKLSPRHGNQMCKLNVELGETIRSLKYRTRSNAELEKEIWRIASNAYVGAYRIGVNEGRARAKQRIAAARRRASRLRLIRADVAVSA